MNKSSLLGAFPASTGKIATAVRVLDARMMEEHARSFGEWLHMRR